MDKELKKEQNRRYYQKRRLKKDKVQKQREYNKDYQKGICPEQRKIYNRVWYEKNKEKKAERNKKYREKKKISLEI